MSRKVYHHVIKHHWYLSLYKLKTGIVYIVIHVIFIVISEPCDGDSRNRGQRLTVISSTIIVTVPLGEDANTPSMIIWLMPSGSRTNSHCHVPLVWNRTWWRHGKEMLSAHLALCERNHLPVESPHKGPFMLDFCVFFVVSPNNLMDKRSRCRSFETPWRSCDVTVVV